MASGVTIGLEAQGVVASEYLMKAFFEAPSFSTFTHNYLTKNKVTVSEFKLDELLQPYNCKFVSQDNNLVTEPIVMEPVRYEVADEFCNADFNDSYESYMLRPGVENDKVTLTDYIVKHYLESTSEELEMALWRADEAGTSGGILDAFDGYKRLMLDSTETIQVAGTTVTSTNVLAEMDKVYDAIPKRVLRKSDMYFYTSPEVAGALQKAWRGQGINTSDQEAPLVHNGIEVKILPGIEANDIYAFRIENVMWASDVLQSEVFIKEMFATTLDNTTRFKLVTSLDCAIGIDAEIVIYSPDIV